MKADSEGRSTLLDLLPARIKTRLYPVGRLDFNSEGLVLLTNDGELAYRLTHPKFKLPKTYEVKVHGIPSERILRTLSQGVELEDGRTRPASVRMVRRTKTNAWLLFTLHEGRKRQIRRMCDKMRLPVSKLKRISIGPVMLKDLQRGQFRYLQPDEVHKLKAAVKLSSD
jgi:pseudouridine synthase